MYDVLLLLLPPPSFRGKKINSKVHHDYDYYYITTFRFETHPASSGHTRLK
jgi:hypothetical protein